MLVEDDKGLREIYGVRLLAEGYDIVSAGDGEEALAMAIKERPQLIISDVMMPKISGFDMLDILRSTTETKNIRVIMMTALSSDEQRERGEQLGADKYLVKSQVGIEDVVKTVHEVLQDQPGNDNNHDAPNPLSSPPPAAPPPATYNTPVSGLTSPPSSIPEPTAPFTGKRPATLGDRVIQPLKDNPRVSNVDVGEPMNKKFAANIQNVENAPDSSDAANPSVIVPSGPPIQSVNAVSMDPPKPPQPAGDDDIDLASLTNSASSSQTASDAPAAPSAPASEPVATAVPSAPPPSAPPADQAPASPSQAAPAVPADTNNTAPDQPSADRSNQHITPPERVPPTIPSYE